MNKAPPGVTHCSRLIFAYMVIHRQTRPEMWELSTTHDQAPRDKHLYGAIGHRYLSFCGSILACRHWAIVKLEAIHFHGDLGLVGFTTRKLLPFRIDALSNVDLGRGLASRKYVKVRKTGNTLEMLDSQCSRVTFSLLG